MNRMYKQIPILFIFITLLMTVVGYKPLAIVATDKQHLLKENILAYIEAHEEEIAGLTTIILQEDDVMVERRGHENIAKQTPIDEDTVFEWASVSKVLIWISIFQLVEAGKIDVQADIEGYLPKDFSYPKSFSAPITIQHLMHHAAGFDDSFTDLMLYQPDNIPSLREALETARIKQVHRPGEVIAYSNYGSALAAYIVEEVSGMSYEFYVRSNIFEPLGMTHTAVHPAQDDQAWVKEHREKIAGYTASLQLIEPNHYVIPMYPVGSVMGTATDLQKLLEALLEEQGESLFQQPQTIERLFKPSLFYQDTRIPRFANGFFSLPAASDSVYGHGGNSKAFSSAFYIDRQEQKGVIVLTNVADENTFTVDIPSMVFGTYAYKGDKTSLEDSAKWQGVYEPVRKPSDGFSKLYGFLLRSKTNKYKSHDLMIHDTEYTQLAPHIYHALAEPSVYSLDIYSESSEGRKILSSTYSDLIHIPTYKHVIDWTTLLAAIIVGIVSSLYVLLSLIKTLRKKPVHSKYFLMQHILNVVIMVNTLWISYQALTMVSYASLKPYLFINLFYIILSLMNIVIWIWRKRLDTKSRKYLGVLTMICAIILSGNILYWEFYF